MRVHSECWTQGTLSVRCDATAVLSLTLHWFSKLPKPVVPSFISVKRGERHWIDREVEHTIWMKAWTFQANESLGHQRDARKFDVAKIRLNHFCWHAVRLLTNNPDKVYDLEQEGINVVEVVPIEMAVNEHNEQYLKAKAREVQRGHSRA